MAYCENCGAKLPEQKEGPGQEKQPGEVHIKCPACGYIRWKNPGPCVSVLVVREGRVLLGRRTETETDIMPGKWCLPCGFVEWGEGYYDAAKREVLEETGLTIQPVSIINVVTNHFGPGTFGDQYPAKKYESLVVVLLAVPVWLFRQICIPSVNTGGAETGSESFFQIRRMSFGNEGIRAGDFRRKISVSDREKIDVKL